MTTKDPILELKDVRFRWPGRASFTLDLPHLALDRGEMVLLLGESGSGKSTLLSLICGTILANSGQITVAGTEMPSLSGGERDRFRAENIGVIFQQFNLLPFASVRDNILLPLGFAPERRARVSGEAATAETLCKSLGLPDDVMSAKASTLSVGQQQRVAVARALIGQPPIIVADEPTSALDADTQDVFLRIMFDQVRKCRSTLLMVSHDGRIADRFDRVLRIEDILTVERSQT